MRSRLLFSQPEQSLRWEHSHRHTTWLRRYATRLRSSEYRKTEIDPGDKLHKA